MLGWLCTLPEPVPPRDEPLRPQFHFTAPSGWLNDPNGLVWLEGEWHLFYQWRPTPDDGPEKWWGHAVSRDLLRWTDLPPALHPDEHGSAWSGSCVVDRDDSLGLRRGSAPVLAAFYAAAGGKCPESRGKPFTQRLAFSTDRGRTWVQHPANPVLPNVVGENRDPKVAWHAPSRRWILALWLEGSTYGLFASNDLLRWTELQRVEMPGCWECPDFFEMPVQGEPGQRRWVLTAANGRYLVGSFDGRAFRPDGPPKAQDAGPNHYAVQTFFGVPPRDGRTIQIAWMAGGSYPGMPFSQQMGIPSELTLRREGGELRLFRNPVRELRALRGRPWRHAARTLAPGEQIRLSGELLDVELEIGAGSRGRLELDVRGLRAEVDPAARAVRIGDRSAPLRPRGPHRLRLLVDRTSVEAFLDGGYSSLSACFVPQGPPEVGLRAEGGDVRLAGLTAWPLRSVWSR
ncbi:MAG: glycoside hydrolase family 32 protein [Fimbriimonadales bacterium]|nr:glycoside hydrolase family 32 protein [Fimbriimonadales bacterium]